MCRDFLSSGDRDSLHKALLATGPNDACFWCFPFFRAFCRQKCIYEFEVLKCLWWLFRSFETANLDSALDQLHRLMLVICKCLLELMLIIMWFDKGECLAPCTCFPDSILGRSDDIFPLLIDCHPLSWPI